MLKQCCRLSRLLRRMEVENTFAEALVGKNVSHVSVDCSSQDENIHKQTKDGIPQDDNLLTLTNLEIKIDKTPSTIVKEGKAEVIFPSTHDVFYNPVQEFNRDISIAAIKQFVKETCQTSHSSNTKSANVISSDVDHSQKKEKCENGITILEALAASGLRSIRYGKEIPGIKCIIANDLSQQAVESIKQNVAHNAMDHLITSSREEASLLMYKHVSCKSQFDVVDLDPYGGAAPFLDAAVQSVKDGGMLLVTCTDMAILCGNNSESCRAKYGAVSLKGKCCHEMALRILLQSVESHANRYGRYIVPLLSLSVDFYIRICLKIYTSPVKVKESTSKLAMVYQCVGCETYHLQPLGKCTEAKNGLKYTPGVGPPINMNCAHCNNKHQIGGPIWISHLHNQQFVQGMIHSIENDENSYGTSKRMLGILHMIAEELNDYPLFYSLDRLCGIVHCVMPTILQFRSALLNAGYKVSYSHTSRNSLKTDAPSEVIWDIIRTWAHLNPVHRKLEENSPAKTILSKEPSITVSFDLHPDANPSSRQQSLLRFQVNPERYWGPKMRARTSLWSSKQIDKQQRFQGKRQKHSDSTKKDLKQFPCKKFKQGVCEKGNECRYSHEVTMADQTDKAKNVY